MQAPALLPYGLVNRRWAILVGLYLLFGVLGAIYLWGSTSAGADFATYQRAAAALWSTGDPYADAALFPEDYRYRYPPLLAMLFPVVSWAPLWFGLVAVATAVPIYVAWRQAGPAGLLPVALLVGAWGQQLLNGNAQAFVVALLAVVPLTGAGGAIGLAVATMLKLHPALAVVWYVGRREWRLLAWYVAALALLLVIQAPWLGAFVRFYLQDPVATETIPGMSVRVLGTVPWLVILAVLAVGALLAARSRYGWLLATLLQLVALPRVLLVNLALLLAAPLPRRDATAARPAPAATPESAETR
jgi:hypothetical protein